MSRGLAKVGHLVLSAISYTVRDSPTLADRAKRLPEWRAGNRRRRDRAMIRSICTRDMPGTSDMMAADGDAVHSGEIPTGTCLDMVCNLTVM